MLDKAKPPGIALIVLGALGILLGLLSLLSPSDPDQMREAFGQSGLDPEQVERMIGYVERFGIALNVFGFALAGFVIYAGVCMVRGTSWGIAFAGSIVAMLPCWCCCILGLPIGIWSLIVLLDKDVKAAFAGATVPPNPPPL